MKFWPVPYRSKHHLCPNLSLRQWPVHMNYKKKREKNGFHFLLISRPLGVQTTDNVHQMTHNFTRTPRLAFLNARQQIFHSISIHKKKIQTPRGSPRPEIPPPAKKGMTLFN